MSWLSNLFKPQKNENADALAGIRQQLMNLSSGVPALAERQKTNVRDIYSRARTEGMQNIGEDVYATRGLGKTSIFSRLSNELIDKLALSQAQAELGIDTSALESQSGLLSKAAGITVPEDEPSAISKILGYGAGLAGQELGYRRLEDILNPRKKGIIEGEEEYIGYPTFRDILANRSGASILRE